MNYSHTHVHTHMQRHEGNTNTYCMRRGSVQCETTDVLGFLKLLPLPPCGEKQKEPKREQRSRLLQSWWGKNELVRPKYEYIWTKGKDLLVALFISFGLRLLILLESSKSVQSSSLDSMLKNISVLMGVVFSRMTPPHSQGLTEKSDEGENDATVCEHQILTRLKTYRRF